MCDVPLIMQLHPVVQVFLITGAVVLIGLLLLKL